MITSSVKNPDGKIAWREAIVESPGPRTAGEAGLLMLKGLCMGMADIIPGVSGGTIALITGIYAQLLNAIRSADFLFVRALLSLRFKEAVARVHLRFLGCLLAGIGTGIIGLSRVMNHLLHFHPTPTWAFFFGLIAASVVLLGLRIRERAGGGGLAFVAGTAGGFILVGLIPVSTPETWWFILFAGIVAICAMILPGVSGAFILLILGKYEYITAALKNPLSAPNMLIIVIFCGGCLIGVIVFSRLLGHLLNRRENITLAMLTGLMLGSLRKIWPWKETLETQMIRGQEYILREKNILPPDMDAQVILAAAMALAGAFLVVLLDRIAGDQSGKGTGVAQPPPKH